MRNPQPAGARRAKSDHTINALKMLERSPEFRQHQAMKDQGNALRTMWAVGLVVLILVTYFDFMAALIMHKPFPGAAISAVPRAWPLVLLATGFGASWVQLASWSPAYDDRTNIVQVVLAHVAASVALAVVPLPQLHLPPFATHATAARYAPAFPACFATLAAGFVLFLPRFTGFWKKRAIAGNLWLVSAPTQLLLALALWWFAGSAVELSNGGVLDTNTFAIVRSDFTKFVTAVWAGLASKPVPTLVALWTQPATIALMRNLCAVLLVHSAALAVSSFAVLFVLPAILRLLGALVPSPRTIWLAALLLNAAATVYSYQAGAANEVVLGVGGTMFVALLVHGYPVE